MFPALDAGQVLEATRSRWDLSGILPVPHTGWLACPVCHDPDPQPRWWRFHERSGTPTIPWRCDVAYKCVTCAAIWTHGVALDRQAWERRPNKKLAGRQVHWRAAQQMLEAHDDCPT